ncbi:helix-turn-helix transcriptional regulator [Streptomyces sp. AM 4-1-1]|uniref:helix-turn-helix domain-containing protein n=1 Tax=Streptomyces sp. AM 4-1-1 TaxID=3028710 RepID=UPI0023B8B57B|nr:helix-turn-helix transcriptional regulator [Streptomyces sp. AM 4-1-1]WEH34671.1 helix-turn-helix transcriptional regulator [Streptomyces sp. AM 4-1-1]
MPSQTPSSIQQAKSDFGRHLREIRLDAGLSARTLAAMAGWHESKCSRFENGVRTPTEQDLRDWALHCRVPHLMEELIATARGIDGMYVEWRRMERSGLKQAQESVLPLWERTQRFRIYSPWLVPGPVQTGPYIKALLTSIRDRRQLVDDVEAAVRVRVQKQNIVHRGNHRFAIVLEEGVLRCRIGGPEVMAGQLEHLLASASLASISLGIVPFGADRSGLWPVEGFFLFDDIQANVELVSAHLTVTQPHELALYADTFSALSGLAVYGSSAQTLIKAAINSLK